MVAGVIRRSALLMTEYLRSFSVVPPCEAFASLFSHAIFDYRKKNCENTLLSVPVAGLFVFYGLIYFHEEVNRDIR